MARDKRVVVAGGGRVGYRLAELLEEFGHTPVVVEIDPERAEELADTYTAVVITGDAVQPNILEQAGLDRAAAVAAVTGDAATNIAVCATAREMDEDIRTVIRADGSEMAEREQREGFVDTVVYPEHAGARLTLTHLLDEGVGDLAALPEGFEVATFEVSENAPVAGRAVSAVNFPVGSRVVGDVSRGAIVRNKTEFKPGMQYMVAFDRGVADEVRNLFSG